MFSQNIFTVSLGCHTHFCEERRVCVLLIDRGAAEASQEGHAAGLWRQGGEGIASPRLFVSSSRTKADERDL